MGLNLDLFIDEKIIKRSRMYKNVKLKALFFLFSNNHVFVQCII